MILLTGTVSVSDVDAFVERLQEAGATHGVTVQAFDARYVVGRAHLERAVELADRALARGENVADDRAVEILLYAAGRRQIDRAFEMGVSTGERPVVVLVDEPDRDGTPDGGGSPDGPANGDDRDDVTDAERSGAAALRESLGVDAVGESDGGPVAAYDRGRVCEFFDVGDAELAAVAGELPDVVCERVALLDVEK